MKKLVIFSLIMLFSYAAAFSQEYIYGLAPGQGGRDVLANGLTNLYSVTGKYSVSADGAGSLNSTYTIDVNKPNAGSTVYKAYLFCTPVWFNSANCTQLNSQAITWDGSANAAWGCCNYYDDVTSIVAPVVNPAAPGIISIPIFECDYIDGYALIVIFADPLASEKTVVIMFGGLSTTGDNFSLTLGEPIDPDAPGALLDMGLGISYSAYGPCGGQRSIIDINGQRLTSSANGEDDGFLSDGALITVGGIGDFNTNPPDPNDFSSCDLRYDDELYSLLPLITNTTTNILINTVNPSNNDNIFLAYFEISGAAIIGEGILLSQEEDVNPLGADHTVTAQVQDDLGAPVVGITVTFEVISGPNAGETFAALTDVNGHAFFTYTGDGGPGFDQIEACFINSQQKEQCSNILQKEWVGGEAIPVSNWAVAIGVLLIVLVATLRFRKY
jgi:hypothetical protein